MAKQDWVRKLDGVEFEWIDFTDGSTAKVCFSADVVVMLQRTRDETAKKERDRAVRDLRWFKEVDRSMRRSKS